MKKKLALLMALVMMFTSSAAVFAAKKEEKKEEPKVVTGELLDIGEKMVKAAMNKAEEIEVPMVITIMDMDGNVVLFQRMKDSLLASMEISQNKAYTAVALKMETSKVKDLAIAGAELQGIAVQHAGRIVEFGGGFPIMKEGKQIGAIGVSGGSVEEDCSVAQAGLDAYEAEEDPELTASGGELLDLAIKGAAAAEAKAIEIGVPMVISVCDMGGNLVLLHRMEDSLLASLEISPNKAFTAVSLKMPSANVKDLAVEGAELQGIAVQHAGRIVEFGGGIPIMKDGKQIGAIGVSGGSVDEDTTVATAGIDAMK